MPIAIVDHQDSFTYNIVDLIRKIGYTDIRVLPARNLDIKHLEHYDKLILSPGPGLPSDFVSIKHILSAYQYLKPILGICLGHQGIATFYGGKLKNLQSVVHGQEKVFSVQKPSLVFENIPKKFQIGLYHSWVVAHNGFPTELEITGTSDDGQIMALQHKKLPIFGLQFHPESYISEYGKEIMANFLKLKQ